jgi:hypothetical protein
MSSNIFIVVVLTFFSCNSPKKMSRSGVVVLNTGFTLEITKLGPSILKAGDMLNIQFTLTNGTPDLTTGYVGVRTSYYDPGIASYNLPIINMAAHSTYNGFINITIPELCEDYKVFLTYFIPVTRVEKRKKNGQTVTVTRTVRAPQCSDSSLFGFHPQLTDDDHDMLDDNIEKRLLEKFRPFLKFSSGDDGKEDFRPVDALYYIRNSGVCEDIPGWDDDQLSSDPNSLLLISSRRNPSSDLRKNLTKTDYHLSPNDDARHGNSWGEILINKNFGLFGHVVPVLLDNVSGYVRQAQYKGCPAGSTLFYKIEYWQLFGFNNSEQLFGIGNHEGDWETVQLLVEAGTEKIKMVFHYAHGKEIRFNLAAALTNKVTTDQNGLVVLELTGTNFTLHPADMDINDDARDTDQGQNDNIVRFTGEGLTHPVVYLEHGSHEFFPSENWRFGKNQYGKRYFAPNHQGDQAESYLAGTPPNLGEVGFPLAESPAAELILYYNGIWGCDENYNPPPPGPTLHYEWTYLFNDLRQIALHNVMEY